VALKDFETGLDALFMAVWRERKDGRAKALPLH
jgi:hypothetical protein